MGQEKKTKQIKSSAVKGHRLIKKANNLFKKGAFEEALPLYNQALDHQPGNIEVMATMADCLTRLGVRDKAVLMMEHAIVHSEGEFSTRQAITMGNLARDLDMWDASRKFYGMAIEMSPELDELYVSYADTLMRTEQFDEAIDFLQMALTKFPRASGLWNVLAISVAHRDGGQAARVFFEEAIRVDPKNLNALHNIAIHCEDVNEAIEFERQVLKISPDHVEAKMGLASYLKMTGNLEEGWQCNRVRLDSSRNKIAKQGIIYVRNGLAWDGKADLTGKSIFIQNEQGIGDEVFYGATMQHIYDQAEQVYIACDKRLISLFQRRFPKAIIGFTYDKMHANFVYRHYPTLEKHLTDNNIEPDYYTQMATLPEFFWGDKNALPKYAGGYLKADPDRSAHYKKIIEGLGPNLKVGIAWQSGHRNAARNIHYLDLEVLAPLFEVEGVDFIKLQYTQVDDEIAAFEKKTGHKIHAIEDLDLKADIEGNFALIDNLDLVISPSISPAIFAMTSGCPVLVMSRWHLWWTLGDRKNIPFYDDAQAFCIKKFGDWTDFIDDIKVELIAKSEQKKQDNSTSQ